MPVSSWSNFPDLSVFSSCPYLIQNSHELRHSPVVCWVRGEAYLLFFEDCGLELGREGIQDDEGGVWGRKTPPIGMGLAEGGLEFCLAWTNRANRRCRGC